MIKTYVYNEPKNNVSHVLTGAGGNTVRFNFEHGNVITHKLPELTLRGKYYQELLENSEMFLSGVVRISHTVADDSDAVEETPAAEPAAKKQSQPEKVMNVRTTDEVIAYVNERFDKDCKTLSAAMKYAAKAGIIFPDYNE